MRRSSPLRSSSTHGLHKPNHKASFARPYENFATEPYFVRDDWHKNVYTPRYNEIRPKTDAASNDHSDRPRDERGTDADRSRDNLDHGSGDRETEGSKAHR